MSDDYFCTACQQMVPWDHAQYKPLKYSKPEKPPVATGCLDYFPDALLAIAEVSSGGNKQHGTTGWDRSKAPDEDNAAIRHFLKRGTLDHDGHRHSAKFAWRALALLQKEIERDRDTKTAWRPDTH